MASWKPFVELKTSSGKPINRGNITITPEAQALTVRLPYWGFVWNRPVAVMVERDGRLERITIFDMTRAAVLVMASIGVAISLAAVIIKVVGRGTAED